MNEMIRISQNTCKSIVEKILKDTTVSVKVNTPHLNLDKISGSKIFVFNPFK